MNNPTGPSTEYIQKIHDYVDGRVDLNANNLFRAHAHRGILLRRLEKAENLIAVWGKTVCNQVIELEQAEARLAAVEGLIKNDVCFCDDWDGSVDVQNDCEPCWYCAIKAAIKGDKE